MNVPVAECWDCAAQVGTPHVDGCDIARCLACGLQRIGCEHEDPDLGWGQLFDGYYPGEREAAELGVDLNQFEMMIRFGRVRLDPKSNRYRKVIG